MMILDRDELDPDELIEVAGSHVRWAIKLGLPAGSNADGLLGYHQACGCLIMPRWCDVLISKTRLSVILDEATIERALMRCLYDRQAREALMSAWQADGCDGVTLMCVVFAGERRAVPEDKL